MSNANSLQRIIEEFKTITNNDICALGITVGLPEEDNYFKWRASLLGPDDTSYAKGIFFLEINFPEDLMFLDESLIIQS